jgi:hypothetical protein
MKPNYQKYRFQMIAGFLAYVLGLFALNYFYAPHLPHKYWLILLVVLPLIYISTTIVRYIADSDEMKRKIYTEALAFSALATGFTCFSYLFIRDMGAPEFRAEWAFYLMWAYYGIGLFVSWRRYN